MIVKIWIANIEAIEKKEDLGVDLGEKCYELVDFEFKEEMFVGFWVDPGEDPSTGTKDIIFYIKGVPLSSRTPYSKELEDTFRKIVRG